MPSYSPPKKNTEYIFYIGLPSQANGNIFQSNPTIAAGDFKVSTDGGALANLSTLPAVTPSSSKMVKVTVSASEMNGDNVTIVGSDAAGGEWKDVIVNIQTVATQIDEIAAAVLTQVVEGSLDVKESLRLFLAVLVGESNGGGTADVVFRDTGDTKDRVAAVVDADGNRISVTLDPS